jgi:hypothetical protein
MKTRSKLLLAALLLLLIPGLEARSALSDYLFSTGSGKGFDMSDAKNIIGEGSENSTSEVLDIGFDFEFDGTIYSQFSVSSNGVLGLGKETVTSSGEETFNESSTYPIIAPFWDRLIPIFSSVSYMTTDTKEGQVLVVQWEAFHRDEPDSKENTFTFQVRLYEGTNKIEFWYGPMTQSVNTSAKIGAAVDGKNFASIYIEEGKKGNQVLVDYENTQTVDNIATFIEDGTLFTLEPVPCTIMVVGNIEEGGTPDMADGDVLLSEVSVRRGNRQAFYPFQISTGDQCKKNKFTFEITGEFADDYNIVPKSSVLQPGESVQPKITFAPGCVGPRPAFLTVSNGKNFSVTYQLGASGRTRMDWIANADQGAGAGVDDGAVLLEDKMIRFGTQESFSPLTVMNLSKNQNADPADVAFTIVDPTGQYSISPASGSLGVGESTTPVITFAPTRFGFQTAVLKVEADCEVHNYTLRAYSTGPGAEFTAEGNTLTPESTLFVKVFECSGESINTIPVTVRSIGNEPLEIDASAIFRTDSVYGQGVPKYPVLRDSWGNPIPSGDYIITDFPGAAPINLNQATEFPIVLNPGESRVLYLNFVAQIPGKRLARVFIPTNALNYSGMAVDGEENEGLLTFDLFGKGIGSAPSGSVDGAPLKPVVFPTTKLGHSVDTTITIYNSGACDLRIDRSHFNVFSGDAGEFEIVSAFPNTGVDQENDSYTIPPGDSAVVTIRFTPVRSGSRRATIWLKTNDSTLMTSGLTERGSLYWDLYGTGTVGVTAAQVNLGPSVIDDPSGAGNPASVYLENTAREPMTIVKMEITGVDATEFAMDPSHPWPGVPFQFAPGGMMHFSVVHTPAAGSTPGPREAQLLLISSTGDTIVVMLRGQAGSRTLTVNPTSLFGGVSIPVGKTARETVMITNTGTLPLKLGNTTITGTNAGDYTLGTLPRLVLAPGQTEYLEITYRPVSQGASSATLQVASNATNGMQSVALGGTATRIGGGAPGNGTSGVETVVETEGMALRQSVPNPAHDMVTIVYTLAAQGDVSLALYDGTGRTIRTLDSGVRSEGDHTVAFSVDDLPNGVYHYRLVVGGRTLDGTMTVVK